MAKTVYDHIKSNNIKTAVLVTLFPLTFAMLVFAAVWIALNATAAPNVDIMPQVWETTLIVAIPVVVLSLAWLGISWMFGDSMMLGGAKARQIFDTQPEYKKIFRIVENTALAAGLPTPRVYIIEDDSLNAFATGRSPRDASVALTRGLIEKLDTHELQGVVAHELAHIGNRDIRLDMILITGVGVTVFMADILMRAAFHAPRSSDKKDNSAILILAVWAAFAVFNWIVLPLLRMAISRKREFAADATGAQITRNPKALASALRKITADPRVEVLDSKKSMAVACIADPLKKSAFGDLNGLLSTHPKPKDRIKKLESM